MHRFAAAPPRAGSVHSKKQAYKKRSMELFPDLGPSGTEDQFLYQDHEGNYHAYFHNMYGTATQSKWWLDATGGHAFSRDGWNWTYTGVAWGCALCRYDTAEGRGALVHFSDATSFRFTRIERPHLIFAGGLLRGDPRYLVVSAQYGTGTESGKEANNGDASYTMVLAIKGHRAKATANFAIETKRQDEAWRERMASVGRRRPQSGGSRDRGSGSGKTTHETTVPAPAHEASPVNPLLNLGPQKLAKLRENVCSPAHCADAGAFCALSC